MQKFGKPSAEYIKIKSFLTNSQGNQKWVEMARDISQVYLAQPKRLNCVVCDRNIDKVIFSLYGVDYALCAHCGHLNGLYQDTVEFTEFLYERSGANDADVYVDESTDTFLKRAADVYQPKAEFLRQALEKLGCNPADLRVADLGSGAGHFIVGLRNSGFENSVGYEISKELVENGNNLYGSEILSLSASDEFNEMVENLDADVLSMIFVLEHIRGLRKFFKSLKKNRSIKYLYFSVPLFNPSVFIEVGSPTMMPRLLGFGHTHLFSDTSIDHLFKEFGLQRKAEWWFGGNVFDIYRQHLINLENQGVDEEGRKLFVEMMLPLVDDLQLVFDKHKFCSEVHIIAKNI